MKGSVVHVETSHRDRWLAVLAEHGVGRPTALNVAEVAGALVQATIGEPPGQIRLEGAPGNVLMFNLSPVQGLRQTRGGRSFVNDMLQGDMTLMPRGVPSQWSWRSACDRLDVIVPADVFGDGSQLDVVDRFLFRDPELEAVCRLLYREVSLDDMGDRLCVESLVMELAALLRRRHSSASETAEILPSRRLSCRQLRRVLDYIESGLDHELPLRALASVAELSPHHFARMFRQTVGIAPHRYVVERRVESAKTMLRTTRASLAEIGLSTGFCSQSHFTSTFQRIVGATPTEFRGRRRRRHEPPDHDELRGK